MHPVEHLTVNTLRELTQFAICPFNQLNRLSLYAKVWIHPIGIIFAGIPHETEEDEVYSHRPFLVPAITALLEDLNCGSGGWVSTETITNGFEWQVLWDSSHMELQTAMSFLANDRYKIPVPLARIPRIVPARLVGSYDHLQHLFSNFEAVLAPARWEDRTVVVSDRATIIAIHWFPTRLSDALERLRDDLAAASGREWASSITLGFTYVWCRDRWADHPTVEGWFLGVLDPEDKIGRYQ